MLNKTAEEPKYLRFDHLALRRPSSIIILDNWPVLASAYSVCVRRAFVSVFPCTFLAFAL